MHNDDHNNTSNRILIVDDDFDNTSLFKIILEDNGFVVDVFNDSTLALSNFKLGLYDLIILDIKMPKMNGPELCRKIRKMDDKVSVCFLTASEIYDESLTSLQGLDQDDRCIISKPISPYDFVKRVKRELNEK
ncbi:MAG TPA: response regulator [Nitrososphaeraceae archaeon]